MWLLLDFGKHEGRSLPQVVLTDPDWFFWAHEADVFARRVWYVPEAELINRRARSIRPPYDADGEPFGVEYLVDRGSGRFAGVQLAPAFLGGTSDRIDLSVPRRLRAYDKTGSQILIGDAKEILFGDRRIRMTRRRCEDFFNDPGNFLDP